MTKISAVIIEDEIPAARMLCSKVRQLRPEWSVEMLSGNVEESVRWFSLNPHPDVIFLDIQLSDGNSFDFIAEAKPTSTIIFTTAYDEYAIRAFSVNSIDYLLKPIDEKRLLEAIEKYESLSMLRRSRSDEYLDIILDSLQCRDKRYRTRFLISGVDKYWTLQVNDIAYFYSENKITFAVTKKGDEHIVDFSLNKLSEQLDPDQFFRANRQLIVSIEAIDRIEPYFNGKIAVSIKPAFKSKITISEDKIQPFKVWLNF